MTAEENTGHAFARLTTFFISESHEMKPCLLVDQALNSTVFQLTKMQKKYSNNFTRFLKSFFGSTVPKTVQNHVTWIQVTHAISTVTLHNSINIKHFCYQYIKFPCFLP